MRAAVPEDAEQQIPLGLCAFAQCERISPRKVKIRGKRSSGRLCSFGSAGAIALLARSGFRLRVFWLHVRDSRFLRPGVRQRGSVRVHSVCSRLERETLESSTVSSLFTKMIFRRASPEAASLRGCKSQ